MDHAELVRLYGPWRGRRPADAAALLRDYPGRWWIAGGWAVDVLTGPVRPHGDLDVSIPREDVPLLHRHLQGRLDPWLADHGALSPLLGPDQVVPATCGNLWLRAAGDQPWEYDVLLAEVHADTWVYERDHRLQRPLADVLGTHDGIAYLRPEVQLLHKAPGRRPVDEADLDACLPLLTPEERRWLADALDLAHPGHPWLARLDRPIGTTSRSRRARTTPEPLDEAVQQCQHHGEDER